MNFYDQIIKLIIEWHYFPVYHAAKNQNQERVKSFSLIYNEIKNRTAFLLNLFTASLAT